MFRRVLVPFAFCAVFAAAQQKPAPPAAPAYQAMVKEAKSHVKEVTVDDFKALKDYKLVDVREDSEWTAGHAAGATHISKGVIERDIETKIPDKNTKVVLYCGGGSRSALAADALQKMGYTNVLSLAGGLTAYKAAGLPVEETKK